MKRNRLVSFPRCDRSVAIGYFLAGEMASAEEHDFVQHCETCLSCQHELAELRPVVASLGKIRISRTLLYPK